MSKDKKPFKETKFGQFLNKAGDTIKANGGDILDIGVKLATGNVGGAIEEAAQMLRKDPSPEAQALLNELELRRMEFEQEIFALEVRDRESARIREVEMAKAGKADWLMYVAGITALGTFVLMVIAVIFIETAQSNPLFNQLMGIIEGVALTVFAYYFGTSKSSSDKQKTIDRLNNR